MIEETILIGDITIAITRKRIKHLHLRVHPPDGRVRVSAPRSLRLREVERFVATRLDWIRRHQVRLREQPSPLPPRFVDGESHPVWGKTHVLMVVERDGRQSVAIDDGRLTLYVRPGSDDVR